MIIEINTLGRLPIYQQLRDQIVLGIASKKLTPGEALPSVRRLAADLGINFHTVNKGYTMLCDEGYIVMDRRKGAVVAKDMDSNENFSGQLSQKLLINAAEAVCHKIYEKEFTALCCAVFKKALGAKKKEGV